MYSRFFGVKSAIFIAFMLPHVDAVPAVASSRESVKIAIDDHVNAPIQIIAHRACWRNSAENSLNAIESCIAESIDMVELDLRITSDGVPILLHDEMLDRTTNGTGRVDQLRWADIKKLRLREGLGGDTPLTGHRIPTLKEALRVAKGRILINLDSKVPITDEILAMIDALNMRDQILFKSSAPASHVRAMMRDLRVSEQDPSFRFQPILRQPDIASAPEAAISAYDAIRPVSYEMDVKDEQFTMTVAPWIAQRCARFWVNSLAGRLFDDRDALQNPDAIWGQMIRLGVNAIQTDEPLALKAFLQNSGIAAQRLAPHQLPSCTPSAD